VTDGRRAAAPPAPPAAASGDRRTLRGVHLDAPTETYLRALVERLRMRLGAELHAVYLLGSAAMGGYLPGRSDLDLLAVVRQPLEPPLARAIAAALSPDALPSPAGGLELVVYPLDEVTHPRRVPQPALRLGPSQESRSAPGSRLIELAMARERGVPLLGRPADELIGTLPRAWQLATADDALTLAAQTEPAAPGTVLAACRAWRYAAEYRWGSKPEAGAWARGRLESPEVVDRALALRAGEPAAWPLEEEDVAEVVALARAALAEARSASEREAAA
jgi:hypothetical protein